MYVHVAGGGGALRSSLWFVEEIPTLSLTLRISTQSPLPPFPYLEHFPTFGLTATSRISRYLSILDFLSNPQQDFHSSCHRFVCPAFNQIFHAPAPAAQIRSHCHKI